ncbi:MAG: hypothetical protein NTY31_01035 [Candidatus Falkowbacteria bacterium]|nr:hypothetical protein [Candidatus Falkowbacteria bacterium]
MPLSRNKKITSRLFGPKSGSALILTMFIMAGMLIVAMSGTYIVFLGIKAGGIQAQSTKAYYAAEAGAEELLWELRWNGYAYSQLPGVPIFQGSLAGSEYNVYYVDFPPLIFRSIGEYQNSKRSVEIRIGE